MAYVSKIYANTLASYNAKFLMDGDRLRRLIDAGYPDALRVLQDYGWGDGLSEVTVDSLLAAETEKLVSFVRENSIGERVNNVLLAPFVFHNAKAAYKGRTAGADVSRALYGGFTDVSDAVTEKDYSGLPDVLAEALEALDEESETSALSPRSIDMRITSAMYAYLLAEAKGDKAASKYVKSEIDLKNLLTLFRLRVLGDRKSLPELFIRGGSLDLGEMTKALEASAEAFNLFYARSVYSDVFEGVEKGASAITELETGIDEYLYALTLSGRDDFLSENPFVNYFHRAMLELKTVRTVLVCLKNNAADEIKRRLRAVYDRIG